MITHENHSEKITLQRSIVIGIGGTGGEVIRILRELIVSKFGALDRLPIVKFLYLDTDTAPVREPSVPWASAPPKASYEGCPECGKHAQVDISLSGHEVIDLQVPNCDGLYAGIREGSHPHYSWFSLEQLESIPNVTKGAGTIRQLGRLCFWQHRARIENALRAQLQDLNSVAKADYMRSEHKIELEPGVSVYIVTSLAGGTGSGCFLDMAYLARRIVDETNVQGANEFVGYLVMPTAFAQVAGANALANGYAALKELNYLNYHYGPNQKLTRMYSKPSWRVQYDASGATIVEYEGVAPFRYCYLVDTGNEFISTDRSEVLTMIATSLFREFTSELASFRKSLRSNVRNRVTSNDLLDCPAEFMSFGHSFVYFPVEEARHVLAYKMAREAVDVWRGGGASGYSASQGLSDNLINTLLQKESLRQDDITASVDTCPDGGRISDIARRLEKRQPWIEERWAASEYKDKVEDFCRQSQKEFYDSGNDSGAWGSYVRDMNDNANQALERYWDVIQNEVGQWEATHGPAVSLRTLEALSKRLRQFAEDFRKRADDPKEIAEILRDLRIQDSLKSDPSKDVIASIDEWMHEEIERLANVRDGILTWFTKDSQVRAQAKKCLQCLSQYCQAKAHRRALLYAAEVSEKLAERAEDLFSKRKPFLAALDSIQAQLGDNENWWNQRAANVRVVGLRLYDDRILTVFEQKIIEQKKDSYNPEAVAEKAKGRLDKPLKDLTDSEDDVNRAAHALFHAALHAMGTISEEDLAETRFAAYDLLTSRYHTGLDNVLGSVAQKSAPYVRLEQDPPGGSWKPSEPYPGGLIYVKQVGIHGGYQPNDQDPDRQRVLSSLARLSHPLWNLGDDVRNVKGTEHILFLQECGGFPLRALSSIDEMKKAYEDHRRHASNPPLHIVRDEMAYRFPDILPPKPEDLERACKLRDDAIKCGLIQKKPYNPRGTGVTFDVYMFAKPGAEQPKVLADTDEAVVNRLLSDPNLADEIEAALAAVRGAEG
ncbi:MAG: tubulin-like doman-containing protein [Armatimonadota bacterium]